MAWIQVIDVDDATAELCEIYDDIIEKRGKLSNIMRVQSLHPKAMQNHMDLYLAILFKHAGLTREDRELLAVTVSRENRCPYCINHDAEALRFWWKNDQKFNDFLTDPFSVSLTKKQRQLVSQAMKLTNTPDDMKESDIDDLRKYDFSDADILDIPLIVSYFNFVNRIALGLGVDFSEDEIKGYDYK